MNEIIKRKIKEVLPQIRGAFTLLSNWVRRDDKSYEDEDGCFIVKWHSVSDAQGRVEAALDKLEWLNEYIDELELNKK